MSIMATWGSKTWRVTAGKIIPLKGMSFSFAQVADNNTSTEDKKPTNQRGTELFTLTCSTTLHSGVGVDVRKEIEEWEALVTRVHWFFLNGKKLGPRLQLRKVGVNVDQLDDFGRMRVATLSLEFKEYDEDTTSVKVGGSALTVKASTEEKNEVKTPNTGVTKAPATNYKVGDYVKITGTHYATGLWIPNWVKNQQHKVSQIKDDQLLLGYPNGINSWVYATDCSLIPSSTWTEQYMNKYVKVGEAAK